MEKVEPLYLYEELMLLALRDKEGTLSIGFIEQLLAGAVLAELLLNSRVSVDESRKNLVNIVDKTPTGEPILDDCLKVMAKSERALPLLASVSQLTRTKNLSLEVIQKLCGRGILREEQDKVLLVFKRRIYPEINPEPEKKIIERLRSAIFTEQENLDPKTVVLISLANGSELLRKTFGRKEILARKSRITQITQGELTGKATRQVIVACQTAVMVAAILPAVAATVSH